MENNGKAKEKGRKEREKEKVKYFRETSTKLDLHKPFIILGCTKDFPCIVC
jgi:hypothetical protein